MLKNDSLLRTLPVGAVTWDCFNSVLHIEPFKARLVQSSLWEGEARSLPVEEWHLATPKSSVSQSRMFT